MSGERLGLVVLAWLTTYLIHSSLLLGTVLLVTRWLPPRLDRVAELCWKIALLGALLSASLQPAIDIDPSRGRLHLFFAAANDPERAGGPRSPLEDHGVGRTRAQRVPIYLASLWAVGAAAAVLRLVTVRHRFQRTLVHRSPIAPDLHRALVQRTGAADDVAVHVLDGLQSPLVHAGDVWLPRWAVTELSLEQLACVFAHEIAHVRRGDERWRWAAVLVERILFVQPLNRLAVRRLRELAECLCDDFAVERTGAPLVLASALATVASRVSPAASSIRFAGAPAMLASRGESLVLRRVQRILASSRPPLVVPSRAGQLLACAASCAILTLLAPRVRTEPADAPLAQPVYTISAEDPAGKFTVMLHGARVIGATIDGRALPHEHIDQRGSALRLIENDGSAFTIQLTTEGGIRWQPRRPRITADRLAT